MIGRAISHYTVLGEIRRGGMGVVYRALDTRLKREVAIKVLPPALVSDEDRKRRFVQEAQAAAALQHANIAVVHEIDESEGMTFIVMELVHGESLKDVMERGPLPLPRALPIARQMAEGLACAHEKGIVHRQSSNLLSRANEAIYATYAGQYPEAIRGVEAVLSANPAFHHAHVTLALARLANGELEKSVEAYRRLSDRGQRGASLAAMGLADVALYEGKRAEAKSLLTTAVEKDVASGNTFAAAQKFSALAEVRVLDGELGAARDGVEKALSLSQDIGTRFRSAWTHLKSGDRARALELTDALASEEDPESKALAGVLRAEAALLEGEPKRAVSILLEARESADTWLGRFALGRAYLDAGAFVEANSELETCLRRRGEATALFLDDVPSFRVLAEVYYYLGRSHEGLGSQPGAAESYRTYLRIKENGEETLTVRDAKQRLDSLP